MKIKLLENSDRFPTLQSQLFYVLSRLKGLASNQFLAYTNNQGINLQSMNQFYEILDTAFRDPDRVRTAGRILREIR